MCAHPTFCAALKRGILVGTMRTLMHGMLAILLVLMVVTSVSFGVSIGSAETGEELVARRRAELEAQLVELEKLIHQQQLLLQDKQGERVTLERDMAILDEKIKKQQLEIRQRTLALEKLQDEIFDKEVTIIELSEKLDREKESLAELIRRTAEIDDLSLVEVVLSGKSFSEFFEEFDDFEAVKIALQDSFEELETLRNSNAEVKSSLENQHASESELKTLQELQKKKIEEQEREKARILNATKGEERQYQELIAQKQRDAAQIRNELFELRGSSAINLGQAIEFANFASAKTGVRAALILGVLKQETRLGEFLGNGSWQSDMHPTRDRPLFEVITKTLGMDPNRMPVSAKPGYGWGGAMGPAQFIPSTWACYGGYINGKTGDCNNSARSYDWDTFWAGPWTYNANADRLRVVRGKQSPSNPWDNQDAFMAAAILMKDNGADAGGHNAERTAALRYFAGWANASNPSYAFYGDGVMEHAAYYQKQIDALKDLNQ